MQVLWIVNIPLPPLCEHFGWPIPVSGGWLYSSAKRLLTNDSVKLSVATFSMRSKELIDVTIGGIRYFVIPYKNRNIYKSHTTVQSYWKQINAQVNPEVVHIHGTEFALGNDYLRVFGSENVVVSIQGLVSAIAPYYCAGISWRNKMFPLTVRDILKRTCMLKDAMGFACRGKIEEDTLRRVKHIIGRTEWDKAHSWGINPQAHYYHCDEVLRDTFYKNQWVYEKCQPHSIFISQGSYPLKGLHFILEALPRIIKEYPDTMVLIAGSDITKKTPWYRYSSYGQYICNIIKNNRIGDHIKFLGNLDEEQMCNYFLKANVYVCPSTIENSPNSLGEAQLLGVPVLASYVGGVPDMMSENVGNIYRFDDVVMLAYKICKLFDENEKSQPNANIRINAIKRHSSEKNIESTLDIYNHIIMSNKNN